MTEYKTIAGSNNVIILDKYKREWMVAESYQSKGDLERELIRDLENQGYEFRKDLKSQEALLANVRVQRQTTNRFDFTINWAKSDNCLLNDLKDFTATFFQKNTLLEVLLKYSVFDVSDTLLVMRPYQIAATERIMWKINSSFLAKTWSKSESGGMSGIRRDRHRFWHRFRHGHHSFRFVTARQETRNASKM